MVRRLRWALAALWLVAAAAAAQAPQPGRDYKLVTPAQPTSDASRVVVTEFFSFACPHCYALNPALTAWAAKLPKDVVFERVAVSFGRPIWANPAKLFYALQALGKADELGAAAFEAIHVEHEDFATDAKVVDWAAKHGIARDAFAAAYGSFSVRTFVTRGDALARAHRVPSVPTLVVDGKYLREIADNGAFAPQLAVVDALIEKARAEKHGGDAARSTGETGSKP